jgi:hypothetical protein
MTNWKHEETGGTVRVGHGENKPSVSESPSVTGLSVKQFEELLKEFADTHFDCGEWRDDEDTEDLRELVEKGKGIKAKLLEAFKNR